MTVNLSVFFLSYAKYLQFGNGHINRTFSRNCAKDVLSHKLVSVTLKTRAFAMNPVQNSTVKSPNYNIQTKRSSLTKASPTEKIENRKENCFTFKSDVTIALQ